VPQTVREYMLGNFTLSGEWSPWVLLTDKQTKLGKNIISLAQEMTVHNKTEINGKVIYCRRF